MESVGSQVPKSTLILLFFQYFLYQNDVNLRKDCIIYQIISENGFSVIVERWPIFHKCKQKGNRVTSK